MMQPKGFLNPKGANKVCKLQWSIYGLVQASRSWNKRFDSVIKAFGFIQTFGEACIYKKVSGSSVAFLILYVDDILLIGNDIEFLDSIKGYLNKSFSMKDLGEAAYILSIKIYIDRTRRLINFFNEYIPWESFEEVQNGSIEERVLGCVTRCEVE